MSYSLFSPHESMPPYAPSPLCSFRTLVESKVIETISALNEGQIAQRSCH